MSVLFPITFLVSIGVAAGPVCAASLDPDKDAEAAVRRYLAIKYDELEEQLNGDRLIYGLAYNKKTPLKPLKVMELTAFMPNTLFYVTELDSPFLEYMHVELLVATTPKKGGADVRTCLSPVFTSASPKFLALFRGLSAKTVDDRKRLALAIGKLFAAITHDGKTLEATVGSRTSAIQLWHGDLHWRDITIEFDNGGTVESVLIRGAKD